MPVKARFFTETLEMCHELDDNLVFLRGLGNTILTIEILLIVQTDVRDKRLGQTERHAACQAVALIVGGDHAAAVVVFRTIAVVGHEVI
jgi:hypothetical protein